MRKLTSILGIMTLLPAAVAQVAEQAPRDRSQVEAGLQLRVAAEKVVAGVDAAGQPTAQLVPLAQPVPGDEIVYTVVFSNTSARVAEHIRITNPIPAQVRYVADSAIGPRSLVLYSVDGGRTFGAPAELLVDVADGSRRAAEPGDYTHIRWVLASPLDAGAKGFARFRAIAR